MYVRFFFFPRIRREVRQYMQVYLCRALRRDIFMSGTDKSALSPRFTARYAVTPLVWFVSRLL